MVQLQLAPQRGGLHLGGLGAPGQLGDQLLLPRARRLQLLQPLRQPALRPLLLRRCRRAALRGGLVDVVLLQLQLRRLQAGARVCQLLLERRHLGGLQRQLAPQPRL
jgi:hypothetical protein